MAFTCTTTGFPTRERSYAAMRAYFDGIKPWRSKYNPDDERPIGDRAVKTNDGRRFNKAMRLLDDGSITFRLFVTDCVTYHPNDEVTIEGYPSMSTSAFIGALAPHGIHHGYRGRRDPWDPVLILHSDKERRQDDWRAYWRDALVIRCNDPVRLHYNAADQRWLPVEPDSLQPFKVPVIDRKAAREASRRYHLPTLHKVVDAVLAMANLPEPPETRAPGSIRAGILDALEKEDYMAAIALMPRGETRSFGRRYGTPNGIKPGYLRLLREHIYDIEGVVSTVERTMLRRSAYLKYVADSRRFGTDY